MTYGAQFGCQAVLTLATLLTIAEAVKVKGSVGGSVLLNCSCNNRDQTKYRSWQLGDTIVLHSQTGNYKVGERYTGRVNLPSSEDCSLLISNVSVADQGDYKCSFFVQPHPSNHGVADPYYDYTEISLSVSASYRVCMDQVSEGTQCQASGGYPESKIQWYLNEKPLHNCSRTDSRKDNFTGLFHLSSNLSIELNGSADGNITCGIETLGLSDTSSCSSDPPFSPPEMYQGSTPTVMAVSVSVPVCVLVLLLVVLALVVRKHLCIKKTRSNLEVETKVSFLGTAGVSCV